MSFKTYNSLFMQLFLLLRRSEAALLNVDYSIIKLLGELE